MTICVLSFDFDGCLFNHSYFFIRALYLRSGEPLSKLVLTANEDLFAQIKAHKPLFSKLITFVGSNRQSLEIDDYNTMINHTESCFVAIKTVATFIDAKLDPFLLADLYGDLPAGTSYHRATADNPEEYSHESWIFDETKASILYAQMHRTAKKNPHEPIEFHFYDDKKDILNELEHFFSSHPELIPPKMLLGLHSYDGTGFNFCVTLAGAKSNIIDANYRKTVKEMAEQAKAKSAKTSSLQVNIARDAQPDLLTRTPFIPLETPKPIVLTTPPGTRVSTPISEIALPDAAPLDVRIDVKEASSKSPEPHPKARTGTASAASKPPSGCCACFTRLFSRRRTTASSIAPIDDRMSPKSPGSLTKPSLYISSISPKS